MATQQPTPKSQRDPALVTLFRGSKKSYDENVDELIAALDAGAAIIYARMKVQEEKAASKRAKSKPA